MKQLKLNEPSLGKNWSMQFMDDSHYDELLNEDTIVYRPDGSILLILLKKAIPENEAQATLKALEKCNQKTTQRSTASGIKSGPYKKMDGSKSGMMRVPKGWEVISVALGSFERSARMPFAKHLSWSLNNSKEFAQTFPLLQRCSNYFKEHNPAKYNMQKEICDRTHPDWVIPGTVFTTLTVNKNFRTAAHLDAGDLPEGFSCMAVLKSGFQKGGNLVLPNWRLATQLDHGDLVMFDPHEYHGNTQVSLIQKGAVRCSIVMYYRTLLQHCKGAEEEFNIAKSRKLGDPLFPGVE